MAETLCSLSGFPSGVQHGKTESILGKALAETIIILEKKEILTKNQILLKVESFSELVANTTIFSAKKIFHRVIIIKVSRRYQLFHDRM